MEQSHDLLNNDLQINSFGQDALLTTAKWAKFLAIVGFIFCVLLVIAGFYMSAVTSASSSYGYRTLPVDPVYITICYVIFAIILFFPCLYLLKFSNKMQEAIRVTNQESLDASLGNLKSFFKFYGVLTIVVLSFYVLAIIFIVIAAIGK